MLGNPNSTAYYIATLPYLFSSSDSLNNMSSDLLSMNYFKEIMLSYLSSPPKVRRRISHLSTFTMENGRSSVSFNNDPSLVHAKTSIGFTLPPCLPGPNPADNSIMIPAIHLHPHQAETFHITSGTAIFTLNRSQVTINKGEEITIPKGEYHRFTNASSTEPMSLEAWYDPADLAREERVFRNLCGYLSDHCSGSGGMLENMSILQLSLFAWEAKAMLCAPSKLPSFLFLPTCLVAAKPRYRRNVFREQRLI